MNNDAREVDDTSYNETIMAKQCDFCTRLSSLYVWGHHSYYYEQCIVRMMLIASKLTAFSNLIHVLTAVSCLHTLSVLSGKQKIRMSIRVHKKVLWRFITVWHYWPRNQIGSGCCPNPAKLAPPLASNVFTWNIGSATVWSISVS